MDPPTASKTDDLGTLLSILNRDVPALLELFKAEGRSPPSLSVENKGNLKVSGGEGLRLGIIRACEKITAVLRDPFERVFVETAAYVVPAATSVIISLKIPHHVSTDAQSPTHVVDLGRATGASPELIWRMMRILTQRLIFEEIAPHQYVHNTASQTLLEPSVEAWVGMSTDDILQASTALLPFLKKHAFQIPEDSGTCAFSTAFNTTLNQFEYYFESDPERGRRAALSMAAFNSTTMFYDFPYPFQDLLSATVVDIGGGSGHVSANIAKKHPHLKFIVQDVGESVKYGKSLEEYSRLPIKWQEHGIFQAQAVKGAEIYMIRHVLHGFPDSIAAKILGNIVGAMDQAKSRILIVDAVVPELYGGESIPFVNATDILAFLGGNGKQRTAEQWKDLIKRVDERLELVRIWMQEESLASADSILEIKITR